MQLGAPTFIDGFSQGFLMGFLASLLICGLFFGFWLAAHLVDKRPRLLVRLIASFSSGLRVHDLRHSPRTPFVKSILLIFSLDSVGLGGRERRDQSGDAVCRRAHSNLFRAVVKRDFRAIWDGADRRCDRGRERHRLVSPTKIPEDFRLWSSHCIPYPLRLGFASIHACFQGRYDRTMTAKKENQMPRPRGTGSIYLQKGALGRLELRDGHSFGHSEPPEENPDEPATV